MYAVSRITVGPYEVIRPIGEGGMAEIYLCVRRGVGGFERQVVLKVLHSRYVGEPRFVEMFLAEARLLARLHHPNIVSVFDVGQIEGVPYLAMDYVDGPTLGRLHAQSLRNGQYEVGYFLHIVKEMCLALHHGHASEIDGRPAGIVHRDISSTNILVDARSGAAKLIDFGIATTAADEEAKTEVGVVKGRVAFLAPEVLRGRRADARSDQFAIGVLLYRLLTNRLPFQDREVSLAMRNEGAYPRVSELSPWVSPELEAIVDRALQPNPAKRYATTAELADDLGAEVARLGVNTAAIPTWIRQVFPIGPEEWTPRADEPLTATSTLHTLSRAPVPRSAPAPRGLVRLLGTSLVLTAVSVAFAGAAVGMWWASSSVQVADATLTVEGYLSAADELLAEGNFEAARDMNSRATTLGRIDVATATLAARQRARIEVEAQRAAVAAQIRAGRLGEAEATLSWAMNASPADAGLQALYAELQQKLAAKPRAARPAVEPVDGELAAPPLVEAVVAVSEAPPAPAVPSASPPQPPEAVRVFHSSELRVKSRVPATYPSTAEAMGLGDAKCLARVWIGETGVPYEVEVSGCPSAFDTPTRDAMLRWRWHPPTDERGAISAQTTIAVQYRAP